MPHHDSPFIPLLIVVFLAFIVPVILLRLKNLRLPIVVGEILAGILIGRSGFGWVASDEPTLEFIAEFGFVFLMFLSGMEIDFSSLGIPVRGGDRSGGSRRGPLPLAIASFVLTLALAGLIGLGLVQFDLARNPWMMALILSTTSLGVVVPVIKEKGLIGSQYGQAILLAAVIADFVTMLLITVLVAILSQGLTFNLLLVGLLFVAFFVVLRFGRFFNQLPAARRAVEELSHATAQIKIRAAFAIMLIFVVLSEALGTEIILGAFLAGACIALLITPDDVHVAHELETIGYGFLIPIFFIKVGVDFNLSALFNSTQAIILVPILVAAAIVVKLLPSLVFRLSFSGRETLSIGVLLSARLSLIIAAAAIGARLGVISDATNAAILLVAILTVTLAPVLFSILTPSADTRMRRPIVVVGAGELGLQVAGQLCTHHEQVVILDEDPVRLDRARQRGFETRLVEVVTAEPSVESVLNDIQTLVCTYADVDRNFAVCQVSRTVFGIPHVVAHVSTPGAIVRFEQIGVRVTNAALDHAALLAMLARNPATYTLLTRTDDNKEIFEVLVENINCVDKKLSQLQLPGDTLVLAVRRNGDLLVPHGNTRIEKGDSLTLVSSLECIEVAQQMFLP
jgi:Kef-type K+ transport system membrane component KefB/Trk K+ transport system NAD-binding subunit